VLLRRGPVLALGRRLRFSSLNAYRGRGAQYVLIQGDGTLEHQFEPELFLVPAAAHCAKGKP
jgi:hypothetical protein